MSTFRYFTKTLLKPVASALTKICTVVEFPSSKCHAQSPLTIIVIKMQNKNSTVFGYCTHHLLFKLNVETP